MHGPYSTARPAYITSTSSAISATTPEVVGDDDDGGVELALEVLQQVEDLRLDGHVERGRRLVGDEQAAGC